MGLEKLKACGEATTVVYLYRYPNTYAYIYFYINAIVGLRSEVSPFYEWNGSECRLIVSHGAGNK